MKIQVIRYEKIAELAKHLEPNKPCSMVVVKDGDKPLMHFVALATSDMDRLHKLMEAAGMIPRFIEVVHEDFVEAEATQNPAPETVN